MIKTRKTKHIDFVVLRMHELMQDITKEAIHSETIEVDILYRKRKLLKKYQRRFKLLTT